MQQSTIFGGFGGQGLLFAGHVLAQAAVIEGKDVSWMPSYGPEMRGGTASCTVIVSDEPIGSPIVDAADAVVALNPPSMAKFENLLVPGGILVLNASLIEAEPRRTDIQIVPVACSAIARAAGDDRLVSVAALGALIAQRPIVTAAAIRQALADLIGHRPALLAADIVAFDRGAADAALLAATPAPRASTNGRGIADSTV
jgi:2-oxoglutarate ferredoxin oxidoreductase subunit gamma